jgi:UBX domain
MLFEFFDENSFDSVKAPKERHRTNTITETIAIDDDDDDAAFMNAVEASRLATKHTEDSTIDDVREAKKPRDDSSNEDVKATKEDVTTAEDVKQTPAIDYGPVPDEPTDKDNEVIKVSIKLANGKSLVRRYRSSEMVSAIFAVVKNTLADTGDKERLFEISTMYPKEALSEKLHQTLVAAGLASSSVIMSWV